MARLFISYKREEQDYAFALRQWLIDAQGWDDRDIFVDRAHLKAGKIWADMIFREAESAEAMLFLASEASLQPESFCYRELRHAKGTVIAVTLHGLAPNDARLGRRRCPMGTKARQIAALDAGPDLEPFRFTSPIDGAPGYKMLSKQQVESIGGTLRDLGVAPNSFARTPDALGGPNR